MDLRVARRGVRRHLAASLILWNLSIGLCATLGDAAAQDEQVASTSDLTCLPLPMYGEAPPGNGGLFIGINHFDDESLPPLRFAVHDAIEQAYLFVVELKLVPPGRCWLALAGSPSARAIEQHLATLRELGITVIDGDRTSIFTALEKLVAATGAPGDFLIVSAGSHGFDNKGIAYIVPRDGRVSLLERTGLSLPDLEVTVAEAKHVSHRLLIIDACQKRILSDGRRGILETQVVGMSDVFEKALQTTSGQGKLVSCSRGETSHESYLLGNVGHGVFTFAVLEALRGGARPDANNLIRLDAVINYVNQRVITWTEDQNHRIAPGLRLVRQSPAWHGPEAMRQMPLAERGDETDVLIAQLQQRVDEKEFTASACSNVVQWLRASELRSTHNREFLQDIRRFAAQEIPARIFVPYITSKLTGQPVRLPPAVSVADAQKARDAWLASQQVTPMLANSLGMQFRLIPAGEFLMGSLEEDPGRDEDEDRHPVRLTRPYYLAVCETTQAQYEQVMGVNPSYFSTAGNGREKIAGATTADFPVESISWHEAVEFCRRLGALPSEQTAGRTYRLPSEAEWEFACLANGTEDADSKLTLADQAWYKVNAQGHARPVGQLAANGFGLHDLLGNVSEWCQDWYEPAYYRSSPMLDPPGPDGSSHDLRVIRGGSWIAVERMCRPSFRSREHPTSRHNTDGFRVVLEVAIGSKGNL